MAILAIQQTRKTARTGLAGPALYLAQLRRELSTARAGELRFRPVASDDYWRLWLATRHPGFNRCLPWPAPEEPAIALERMRSVMADEAAGRLIAFACERPDQDRQWVAIFRFTAWRDGLETGLWLHPDGWGKGYGTGIIATAIETAFARTAIPAVYSKTTADNVGACRITTRCGMTAIGPASAPDDRGGTIQGIEWRITREEAARRAGAL
ncbi:MAG: GNAT family N-acetyltransferase [Burkholderiaceae bacterium]